MTKMLLYLLNNLIQVGQRYIGRFAFLAQKKSFARKCARVGVRRVDSLRQQARVFKRELGHLINALYCANSLYLEYCNPKKLPLALRCLRFDLFRVSF